MEFEKKSSGVAKAGLTTGIIGTTLGTLGVLGAGANGIGNLFGPRTATNETTVVPMPVMPFNGYANWGWGNGCCGNNTRNNGCCNEDHLVDRYEASLQAKIAEKDTQIALRDANTYNDQKNIEMYKYVDSRFREFEQAFAAQAVNNQKTADDVLRVQQNLDCCCKELRDKICDERRERKCADNTIITYANATFYPKLIAGVTPTATTTPQQLYNPIPQDNNCCCGNN